MSSNYYLFGLLNEINILHPVSNNNLPSPFFYPFTVLIKTALQNLHASPKVLSNDKPFFALLRKKQRGIDNTGG